MANDISTSSFRALIVPDTRATLLDGESSYKETGPKVDTPTRESGDTFLTLNGTAKTIHSSQESETLRIRANRSGMLESAAFIWKQQSESSTSWRGWNPPNVPMSWTSLAWTDGSGSPFEFTDPHAITLDDESVVLAFERKLSSTREVVVRKYDSSADTWSAASTVFSIADTTATLRPCLVKLPSGRLLLFLWTVGSDTANIRMYFSANDGVSWVLGTNGVLNTPIGVTSATADYSVSTKGRLRAVYIDGVISMVGGLRSNDTGLNNRDVLVQWASNDFGASFDQVGSIWGGTSDADDGDGSYQDLQVVGGDLALLYMSQISGSNPQIRKVGSPYTEFRTANDISINASAWGTVSSATFTDGDLASWVDTNGTLFVIGRQAGGNQEIIGVFSTDNGATFEALGRSTLLAGTRIGEIVETGVTTSYPRKLVATGQGARGLLFHSWKANVGNEEDSISVLALGGFSSLSMPSLDSSKDIDQSVGYSICWFPFDVPSDSGWTGAGTGTATLASGYLALASDGSSKAKNFRKSNADAFSSGIIFNTVFKVNAGGSIAANQIGATLRLADGTNDLQIALRATTTSFAIYDVNGTAQVGSTVSQSMTSDVEFLITIGGTTVRSWYRVYNSKSDSSWTIGPTGTIVDAGASGVSTNTIKFGRMTANVTADCSFRLVRYTTGDYTGESKNLLVDGQTNPDDLRGRYLNSYIEGGISVGMIDGPAYREDEHSVGIVHDYAVERCLPDSKDLSPRVEWRSTDETEQSIALLISRVKTEVADAMSDQIGIGLFGINFRTATIEGYDGSSWSTLYALDTAPDLDALSWERKGNTVRPTSNASPLFYLFANEYKDSYFKFAADGECRKIDSNAGGSWSALTTRRRVAISLVDTDGTEGSSGSVAAIWPKDIVLSIPLLGVDYAAFRIKITASQGTAEGYYKIGQIVFGSLVPLANEYSYGRSIETTPNTEIITGRDGSTRASVLGPSHRIVEVGWEEGVDSTAFGGASPDPDYFKACSDSSALPVSTKGETLRTLEGILRETEGGRWPLVYVPRLQQVSVNIKINRRDELILCRLTSALRRDSVLGEETVDEVTRVSKITLEEII